MFDGSRKPVISILVFAGLIGIGAAVDWVTTPTMTPDEKVAEEKVAAEALKRSEASLIKKEAENRLRYQEEKARAASQHAEYMEKALKLRDAFLQLGWDEAQAEKKAEDSLAEAGIEDGFYIENKLLEPVNGVIDKCSWDGIVQAMQARGLPKEGQPYNIFRHMEDAHKGIKPLTPRVPNPG
jgi:hypothetical protein